MYPLTDYLCPGTAGSIDARICRYSRCARLSQASRFLEIDKRTRAELHVFDFSGGFCFFSSGPHVLGSWQKHSYVGCLRTVGIRRGGVVEWGIF